MMNNSLPWHKLTMPDAGKVSKLGADPEHIQNFYWAKNYLGESLFLFDIKDNALDSHLKTLTRGMAGVDIDFKRYEDSETPYLVFTLQRTTDNDLFYSFCCDLMASTVTCQDAYKALMIIDKRVSRWQKFLKKGNTSLLSLSEKQGLFCELEFIKWAITTQDIAFDRIISCWEGPAGQSQDFILDDKVFEIKSYSERNKNKIRISTENQLYSDRLEFYLRAYSVSIMNSGDIGFSLNDQVCLIKDVAGQDSDIDSFENKLLMSGYIELLEYNTPLFKINTFADYEVTDKFPRIVPDILPEGVSKVSYDLDLSAISKFKKESSLL